MRSQQRTDEMPRMLAPSTLAGRRRAASDDEDARPTSAPTERRAASHRGTGDDRRTPPTPTAPRRDATAGDRDHRPPAGEVDYMWTPNADVLAGAEGEVNLVAWAGYVEDGSTDPASTG